MLGRLHLLHKSDALTLQELDVDIEQKKSLLKSNDPSIKFLQRQRAALSNVINRNLEISASDAMLRYSELLRSAEQDQSTLKEISFQLQSAQLEKARQNEPWQMISTPTLLDVQVAPHKKRIVALGMILGLLLGSGSALIIDRRKGLLWSLEDLQASGRLDHQLSGALPCCTQI